MEANRDMIDPEIESMMMRAAFEELSPAEQRLALDALGTPEQYDRMRAALLGARSVLAPGSTRLEPRGATRDSLHAAMAARRRRVAPARGFWLTELLSRRIPIYQPVAALAFMAIIVVVYLAGRESGVRERIVYRQGPAAPAVQVDTDAIVERVVDSLKSELARASMSDQALNVSTVVRGRDRRLKSAQRADTMMRPARRSLAYPAMQSNQFVGLGNLPQLDRQQRGKSIAEDSTIGRFRSRMISERL